jgi:hypothetical protein
VTPHVLDRFVIVPTLAMLGPRYESEEARAMLIAIALQESGLRHRRQIRGPARGWWQFETAGVAGVRQHGASEAVAQSVMTICGYDGLDSAALKARIEHNDMLACAFARLLLATLPARLPTRIESEMGWDQYLTAWRPGHPRAEKWERNYDLAWSTVYAS